MSLSLARGSTAVTMHQGAEGRVSTFSLRPNPCDTPCAHRVSRALPWRGDLRAHVGSSMSRGHLLTAGSMTQDTHRAVRV